MPDSLEQRFAERLRRLEDIDAIQKVKARYFRSIDTCDIDTLRTLFAEDIEVDYVGGTYRWELKGREALLKSLKESFNPETVGCHTGHHPEIEIVDDTTATGVWYLTDIFINYRDKTTTTGSAIYRDTYRKIDGDWKIARTTYKRIYECTEPYDKAPNVTFSHLATLAGR